MTRKLKILVKNGQISMKKSFKNGRFGPIFDEKKTLRDYSICGAGFFLKNDAGTRAALFKIFKLCNFALFAFRFNVLVTWFNQKFCGSQKLYHIGVPRGGKIRFFFKNFFKSADFYTRWGGDEEHESERIFWFWAQKKLENRRKKNLIFTF